MHKVSVIGIDNSGKTSLVKRICSSGAAQTIHLTMPKHERSRTANILGKSVQALAQTGERNNLKSIAAVGYLMHLAPYAYESRTYKDGEIVFSDRDPIIDVLCYAQAYLPREVYTQLRTPLRSLLKSAFGYPSLLLYLDVSVETSLQRGKDKAQLHDKLEKLIKLKGVFEEEISYAVSEGVSTERIDTENKSLEEVASEVQRKLMFQGIELRLPTIAA